MVSFSCVASFKFQVMLNLKLYDHKVHILLQGTVTGLHLMPSSRLSNQVCIYSNGIGWTLLEYMVCYRSCAPTRSITFTYKDIVCGTQTHKDICLQDMKTCICPCGIHLNLFRHQNFSIIQVLPLTQELSRCSLFLALWIHLFSIHCERAGKTFCIILLFSQSDISFQFYMHLTVNFC